MRALEMRALQNKDCDKCHAMGAIVVTYESKISFRAQPCCTKG
jgi:hypothetical protein